MYGLLPQKLRGRGPGALFLFLCVVSVSAGAAPDTRLDLGLELYGNGWESPVTQSRIAGAQLGVEFRRDFSETFRAVVAGNFQLESGLARSRFNNEFGPKQAIRLREASLRWSPLDWLRLSVGSLDQDRWDSPLLLRRQSFPALLQELRLPLNTFELRLEATQAFAADTSSLNRWGNWDAGMPTFFLERVSLLWTPGDRFSAGVHGSHFLFQHLSHGQAYDAQFLGNSVIGIGPENAAFVYGHQGFEVGADVSAEVLAGFRPFVVAQLVTNSRAPRGRNAGGRLQFGVGWELGANFRLRPSVEFFQLESDASPAYFNTRVFGHNNRAGWGATLAFELPRTRVQGQLQYLRSRVLQNNPLQSPADWVSFALRMDYDVL